MNREIQMWIAADLAGKSRVSEVTKCLLLDSLQVRFWIMYYIYSFHSYCCFDIFICSVIFCFQVNHYPGSGYVTNKVSLATSDIKHIPKAFKIPKDKDAFLEYVSSDLVHVTLLTGLFQPCYFSHGQKIQPSFSSQAATRYHCYSYEPS